MARPRKTERNKEIIIKKDKKKWSLRKIASHYRLHPSTVHEIYIREKALSGLSTG